MKLNKFKVIRYLLTVMIFGLLLASCPWGDDDDPRPLPVPASPPTVPINIRATATSSTSIAVTWDPVSNADNYEVHYQTGSLPITRLTTVSGTQYSHTGLQPNTSYYYYVTAKNSLGTSDLSSRATATTLLNDAGGTKPAAPTGVNAALASSNSIRVTWNPVPLAVSYDVHYTIGSSSDKNFKANVTNPEYTHNGLQSNTRYSYYIVAKNSAGDSGYSSAASVTTPTITYTVTYNPNNGSGTIPNPQSVNAGSTITLPSGNGLSRSGYTFGGWNTNASGTGTNYAASSSFSPTGDITLYAKWDAIPPTPTSTYTVTYNINGGSGTTPGQQTVNAGSSITLNTGSGLSRSGYTFDGWNTNASGTGINYPGGSSFTPTSTIMLYAKWNAIPPTPTPTYTVTYNINGGSGTTPSQQTVNAGSSITLNAGSGLSRSGYTFGGWNTNASGTGTNYAAGSSFTPTSTLTLYARWETVKPATPTNVTASPGRTAGSLMISWNKVDGDVDHYNLYYSINSTSAIKTKIERNRGDISASFTHTGLSSSRAYYYFVTAVNSAGDESEYSAPSNRAVPN